MANPEQRAFFSSFPDAAEYFSFTAGNGNIFCCTNMSVQPLDTLQVDFIKNADPDLLLNSTNPNHPTQSVMNQFLSSIQTGKIRGPPPSDPSIMEGRLHSAQYVMKVVVRSKMPFWRSYLVPSEIEDGCWVEVCRGKLSFEEMYPQLEPALLSNLLLVVGIGCSSGHMHGPHPGKWSCYLHGRKD